MVSKTIAFLGIGLMGAPMAQNLLKAGFNVHAWNRTIEKTKIFEPTGAIVFDTACEAVRSADFVITMLSDGAAVHDLMFKRGVADAIKSSAALIDMSSIKTSQARTHAKMIEAIGLGYLDAPVSGGTKGAQDATLAIMVGGDPKLFERAQPILAAMGRPTLVGPCGSGQLAKLANQAIVATTIGIVAEALLLAKQAGADPNAIRYALKGGFADSVILQQHGERMVQQNFAPGGKSISQLKDLDNALETAKECGLCLPLTEQMQTRYSHFTQELDGSELDHSGIYLELLYQNGLKTASK